MKFNLFLNALKFNKFVTKVLVLALLYLVLFLINTKLKTCAVKFILNENSFMVKYCLA